LASVPASSLQPRVDVEQASHYLKMLYGDTTGFGSLILLGNGRHERHCFFNIADLHDEPSSMDASLEALQDVVDNRWNVYSSMAAFAHVPDRGRGTRAAVLSIPGVWADVDVKPDVEGYFSTEAQVSSFIARLPVPTLEVASGSGGRHLYWLTHERVEAREGQKLLLMWLDFLRDAANGFTIENVHDTTRILRLPGTVRWPKEADSVPLPHKVETLRGGPRYHADELQVLAQPTYDAAQKVRNELRARRAEAEERRRSELIARGLREESYERITRTFRIQQDWATLLETTGWTLHSDQRDGAARCRYWTRPGKSVADGKSASTDFTDKNGAVSPLMTLYSNDPALADLRDNVDGMDAVGVVSKWTYALKRIFNGDEAALLRVVATHHGRLS
jgi:hypothetical protein